MIRITVTLPEPKDREGFDNHYFGTHLPLIKALPFVEEVTVNKVFESNNLEFTPYLIAQFSFKSKSMMEESLASSHGGQLYSDVENLMNFLSGPPRIVFSETLGN
ncbi:EthD family reductase [Ammoniphilus sp. CFH 90114]|uniref:EthD family reductase n=1 Tax=Ammoniphilus sp. CFH 90114 TaxID=2493665 RepID=UPI00100F4E22|nr:EthD family reductase [Ammoniphilus sp. CFH 90114]RXT04554.1 EthD family reductase [Ammoniphilus sp. CFH 90114]